MGQSESQFESTSVPSRVPFGGNVRRNTRLRRNLTRRGMTILEVSLALALMSFVIVAMYSAIGFASAMAKREQQRLGAAELASALIVQYLDDKASLPTQQPIDYGPWKFRYHMREDKVGFIEAKPAAGTARTVGLDRLKQVTITVWLSEETEGSFDPDGNSPQVALTRIVDPLALRNPDSFANMMSSDSGRRSLGEQIAPGGGGGGGGASGTRRGGAPQAPKTPKTPAPSKGSGLPPPGSSTPGSSK